VVWYYWGQVIPHAVTECKIYIYIVALSSAYIVQDSNYAAISIENTSILFTYYSYITLSYMAIWDVLTIIRII